MLVKSTLFMGRAPPTRGCNDRCRRRIVNNPSVKLGHEFFSIDTKGTPYPRVLCKSFSLAVFYYNTGGGKQEEDNIREE